MLVGWGGGGGERKSGEKKKHHSPINRARDGRRCDEGRGGFVLGENVQES